jgi:Protein of unknown function (DUF1761)
MIFDGLGDLDWLAVAAATAAWFVYSAIYYSLPPISKAWAHAAKIPEQQGAPLVPIMVATLVLYFVMTTVIALLVQATGTQDVMDGVMLGVALGIAFGLAQALISQMYEQKGSSYWLINGVNSVVSYSIVCAILVVMD